MENNICKCGHSKDKHYGTHITFGANACINSDEDRPAMRKSPGGCMAAEDWELWDKDRQAGNKRDRICCYCRKFKPDNLKYLEQIYEDDNSR